MAEFKVGLVTVTYNSGAYLDGFFSSLWAQSHSNFIVVAVDNDSRDDTLVRLRLESDSRLKIISNASNLGVAEGNNQGIRVCLEQKCDFVLLINNDTEFGPELISTLVGVSEAGRHSIVVPKMYYFEPPNMIWCAGGFFSKWSACHNGHFGEGEIDVGQYDQARAVDYCPTCCMLIRSEVFAETGLMDSEYFVYYDDVDFCIKAKRKGISIQYTSIAKLWHKVSGSTGGEESAFSIKYLNRNRALLVKKNFRGFKALYYHAFNILYLIWRYLKGLDSFALTRQKLGIYAVEIVRR